ncbi:PD-(D/E)XK motif protein [Chelativorans alearense]|uniref:PD-(D/E)XK motif protein n=1 Tax=Chelativorans alearense TaxID=2681495 RepID=UPI0013D7FA41|nr:PD-(D/E)XK motif protein [Chelativorans alearense]
MMATGLADIFEAIPSPSPDSSDKPLYAVMPVPGHTSYFVGKDRESLACLLVSTSDQTGRPHPPIRLESLDAQFELRCHLKKVGELEREGTFTVIRCRDSDSETTRYFLSVCETILRMLGDNPARTQIATAVNRLAAIFQRVRQPPARPLNGLFGELYLLFRSGNAVRALRAWRTDENARFDFSDGDVRLDVKATGGRGRIHSFSYEQCNPSSGTIAVVASLHAEQAAGGMLLHTLMEQIEARVSAHADLVLKLHETVAATLGASLNDALSRRFDMRLAESSLQFFSLEDVPAIRGALPAGVSDVHFRSDLSTLASLSVEALIDKDPVFWDLLPRPQ